MKYGEGDTVCPNSDFNHSKLVQYMAVDRHKKSKIPIYKFTRERDIPQHRGSEPHPQLPHPLRPYQVAHRGSNIWQKISEKFAFLSTFVSLFLALHLGPDQLQRTDQRDCPGPCNATGQSRDPPGQILFQLD